MSDSSHFQAQSDPATEKKVVVVRAKDPGQCRVCLVQCFRICKSCQPEHYLCSDCQGRHSQLIGSVVPLRLVSRP